MAAARMNSVNNLKQLVLAMHNYHDVYGQFPADATYDKAGKPLLSWRVAILPFIEQDNLHKQFKLDEPWDSDHNKKLLEKMPPLFGFGDATAAKNHETHYQGFVGKGAFFDGKKGVKVTDITDGTSNTIMLVEAKKAVPWTKPDDVPFDAGKLVPKLGGLFDGIFNVAMCDGSVRSFPLTIKEDTLRALPSRPTAARSWTRTSKERSPQRREGHRGGSALLCALRRAFGANVSEDTSPTKNCRELLCCRELHHALARAGVEPGPSR